MKKIFGPSFRKICRAVKYSRSIIEIPVTVFVLVSCDVSIHKLALQRFFIYKLIVTGIKFLVNHSYTKMILFFVSFFFNRLNEFF